MTTVWYLLGGEGIRSSHTDLVEMSRENEGYRYSLTVIDTFSKYANDKAVKKTSASGVAENI